ncbi:hypothetical protein CASFOL_040441 [Castilleja foliolosa]|uniref:Uncharacterized protein n=1 Tax=Castilleja foliolosa TaxID=1961234 RepID=A0ABD3BBM7_9LAMI
MPSGFIRILPPSHIELLRVSLYKHLNHPPRPETFRWGSDLGLRASTRSLNPFPKYASHEWGSGGGRCSCDHGRKEGKSIQGLMKGGRWGGERLTDDGRWWWRWEKK